MDRPAFASDEIIVELKSVQNLSKKHEVQLVNYLNGLKKEIGLLINFGPAPLPEADCVFTVSSHRGVGPYRPEAGNCERENQVNPVNPV